MISPTGRASSPRTPSVFSSYEWRRTGKISEARAVEIVKEVFDLRPAGIIEQLDLLRPIYRKTSAYGHFGRKDPDFTWERTDKADDIKDLAGI